MFSFGFDVKRCFGIQNFGFWGDRYPLLKDSLKRIKILGIFGQCFVVFKIGLDLFMAVGLKKFFCLFPVIFFFYFFWIKLVIIKNNFNRSFIMKVRIIKVFQKKIKSAVSSRMYFSRFVISIIFFFLIYSKLWKLVPLTIRVSSKIVWTFGFAVLCWLSINLSRLWKKILVYFSHYTTLGSPIVLVPFINIIEVIRKIIRPITLGVRLAVNLLTGHLLLSMFRKLHTSFLLNASLRGFAVLWVGGLMVFFYEFCVCIVQALVYALMIAQYFDEHSK